MTDPSNSTLRRVVVASILGNGLEWFDFVTYGYFSSIIAHVFFKGGGSAALLLTYATFAVGFVVRPIGGIVLGMFADRHGRRPTLALVIAMMAFGTLTLGVTPSYATIGLAAPVIVVIGRVIQGISIGGEFASATTMLVEYVPPERRMTFGSFQMSAQAVGRVFAAGIGLLVIVGLPKAEVQDWAWRIPFLLGALVGPFGFYIRYRLTESPEYREMLAHGEKKARAPIMELLRSHGTAVFCGMGIVVAGTALTYIWNTYLPTYVVRQLHLPLWEGLVGVLVTSAFTIFTCVLGGWIADRVGAYRVFFFFTVVSAVVAYPLFAYVLAAPSFTRLFEAQLVALTLFGLQIGPSPGLLASLFPVRVRSTGMAVTYNVAVTLFGGFAPLTVTGLIAKTGNNIMPAYYLIGAAAVSLAIVGTTFGVVRQRSLLTVE
jgi:MFS transporter, MHS family, proline/betaine transporter